MTNALKFIARKACHQGRWLFAACEAHDEGREVVWFDAHQRAMRLAERRAELSAA